ncbi:MAG: CopG family transcriptional regulator [Candidatus Methylomirabilis sp.]
MARATVFLSDDLLRAVDAEAEREGISRSALFQKAAEAYLDQAKRERQEVERRRAMEEACLRMDKLAEKLGNWDAVAIIRQFREPRRGSRTRI